VKLISEQQLVGKLCVSVLKSVGTPA